MYESDNRERHLVLEDLFNLASSESGLPKSGIDVKVLYRVPEYRKNMRHQAVLYLIADNYLQPIQSVSIHRNNKEVTIESPVVMTEKGLIAYHSGYFFEKYKDKIEDRNFKRWTLFLIAIVSASVIYDRVFKRESKNPGEIQIQQAPLKDSSNEDSTISSQFHL